MRNLLAKAALYPVEYCPADELCYSVAVPDASAAAGSGNIYIQLRAPASTYSWVGLGQGTSMSGANMFLLYTDGTGNVTLSPRSGTGNVEPQQDADADVELLAGSGVDGGTMTANFRCGSCASWAGGSGEMSLAGTSTNWIAAWKQGAALDTTDLDASITRHGYDEHGTFQLDLTQATVSEDANPYVDDGSDDSGGSGDGGSSSGGDSDTGGDSGGATSPGAVTPGASSGSDPSALILAHWVIMLLVWVILFPLGSALMPLFGKWALHAAWQSVAFILMWVGFALGYVASERIGLGLQSTHTKFGTVVVCLAALQPAAGYLHHRHYLRHAARGAVSHAHIWYGRALIVMGVVNGGLGIQLASGGRALTVGYSVAAAVVAVIYLAATGYGVVVGRRRRAAAATAAAGGGGGAGTGSDADGQPAKEYNQQHRHQRRRPFP